MSLNRFQVQVLGFIRIPALVPYYLKPSVCRTNNFTFDDSQGLAIVLPAFGVQVGAMPIV